jgi:FkbM family methyltransferase
MSEILSPASSLDLDEYASQVRDFWREFQSQSNRPKLVFGRNVYGPSLLEHSQIDAFIDDFTTQDSFCDRPVIRSSDIPKSAMVIIASGGRPLTVRKQLRDIGVQHADYFGLQRWSGAGLKEIVFNEGFPEEFAANQDRFEKVYRLLADEISRDAFRKIVSFRLYGDLRMIEGFVDRQKQQYFEEFLSLRTKGEVFYDVGGFDGETSWCFAQKCPEYRSIHIFEPEQQNLAACRLKLQSLRDIHIHRHGLSDRKGSAAFRVDGSASGISSDGDIVIPLERLDDLGLDAPTFIKMDIEGAELPALAGGRQTIVKHRPRLAIAAYHSASDLWRIPELILDMDARYKIHMRHYTESIYETVLFFTQES